MTREGMRGNDVMQGLLKGVPDKEIVALAVHFSKLKAKSSEEKTDQKLFNRGKDDRRQEPLRELPRDRLSAAASRCRASPASARSSSPR